MDPGANTTRSLFRTSRPWHPLFSVHVFSAFANVPSAALVAVAADSDVVAVGATASVALACTIPQQFADKFAIKRTDEVHVRGVW